VPVNIHHAGGDTTVLINQRQTPPIDKLFVSLGKFRFDAGQAGWVEIANKGTNGYVIVDAIQFLPLDAKK
jgi:hypothetical protein